MALRTSGILRALQQSYSYLLHYDIDPDRQSRPMQAPSSDI